MNEKVEVIVTDVSNHSNNNNSYATSHSILPTSGNKNNDILERLARHKPDIDRVVVDHFPPNRGVDNFSDINDSSTPPLKRQRRRTKSKFSK